KRNPVDLDRHSIAQRGSAPTHDRAPREDAMRFTYVLAGLVLVFAWAAEPSQSDSQAPSAPTLGTSNSDEPITGTAVTPNPGAETQQKDPFAPYGVGPPEAIWTYSDLSSAEQAQVDRNRDTTGWQPVHNGYRQASMDLAVKAKAEAAAIR